MSSEDQERLLEGGSSGRPPGGGGSTPVVGNGILVGVATLLVLLAVANIVLAVCLLVGHGSTVTVTAKAKPKGKAADPKSLAISADGAVFDVVAPKLSLTQCAMRDRGKGVIK